MKLMDSIYLKLQTFKFHKSR